MGKITLVKSHRDNKIILLLILFSIIFVSLLIWGANVFSKFEQYVDISSKNTIAAMMEQIERSYQMQLDSMFEDTERLEEYLFENEKREITLSEYDKYFRTIENESVRDIVFVNRTGQYISDDGKSGVLELGDIKGSMFDIGGETAQYCTWRDGEEIFVIAKKYETFYIDNNEYEVIAFIYNLDKLNDLFVDSAYGGQAKLYVTNSESMVTYADLENKEGIVRNYNILEHYLDESVIGEEQYSHIVDDFRNGRENCVTLSDGTEDEYFYYQPLEGTEYFLVFEAPCKVVQSVLTDYQKKVSGSWMITVILIAVTMIILAVGSVGAIHMRTWGEYERQTLNMKRENNAQLERMNAAVEKTIQEYRQTHEKMAAGTDEPDDRTKREEMEKRRCMEVAALSGKRFLLADDNDMSASLLQELLTSRGADCVRVKTGEQVLKIFGRSKPGRYQYILMDVEMPEMDGYETTQRLRSLEHLQAKEIPVFAMTYHASPESMRKAVLAGMSGQMEKPVSTSALAAMVMKLKEKEQLHK